MSAVTYMRCRQFALCDNLTDKALAHPVLGPVPCCVRCAEQVGHADELRPLPDELAEHFIPAATCPCGGTRVDITLSGLVCASCGKAV